VGSETIGSSGDDDGDDDALVLVLVLGSIIGFIETGAPKK
jgi:hypothetical protein